MKDIIYFLKQIHSYAGKILYINMIAMTFIGLLESVGTLLLISLIGMSGIVNMNVDHIAIFNLFGFLDDLPASIRLSIILGIYFLVIMGYNLVERQIVIRNGVIQNGFLRKVRTDTYSGLLHANWDFFIKNRKSDLINLLLSEVTRTSGGIHAFLQFMASLIFTVIQIALAFWLSPNITIFVLISGVFIVFLNRKFLKKSLALGNRNYELARQFYAGTTDQINGIKDIKSNSLEESRMQWFRLITKNMELEQVDYLRMKTTSQLYYKVASSLLMIIFIFVAIKMFQAQAGQLMLIILIFGRLWPRVAGIQSSLEQIATTLPSFKAVKRLQEECQQAAEFQQQENVKALDLKKGIECRNIHFRYNKNETTYALKDINLWIPSNEMTAFVGRSGAGKSTLIDLLMGLNQPESGQVLLDGIPLTKENLLSLRSSLSYVPQDPFLFNASIRENLMLVKPEASEEDMWEALSFASAAEFVGKLPNGLDSLIGDRGIKLSGGERQRLVLARAILRKPTILVLDEATSALDTESEANIQLALERLKGKMTIIVIAHRMSTIRNANQVIVLEEGQVIQQGGFNQLSQEKNKMFSKLLGRQMESIQ
ncbi:ABC transporter ATP-binding protein [Peribacillus psychrosaccharolyticus]|uniref:ABC transporter ATP-binding protein n=2 Tax=Peribacillus psychrosaccharolyticus TaxID=1407 RepID=A0A974NND9_PERPY|nr:ABC transporter ATP-binding protein [Peribacillus psychrosaccharolyticus]MEC2056041.1 ABC transporter ATP-binding protein [Peribacillus psychrosaccharolyticus]MED3745483.1 ABC transporter ATP-binding protein [Peribacillus psychrosaccharolyticus]QQT00758.1 ABC transporter ATP-binding protein [Peribacillus psychrosaccharolyticus]